MKVKLLYKIVSNCLRVGLFFALLTITAGIAATGAMAQDQGGEVLSAIIENNVITGNTAGSGGGIACHNCLSVIRNNLLTGNSSIGETGGGAFYAFGSAANPALTGNTFSENIAASGFGGGHLCGERPSYDPELYPLEKPG